MNKHFLKAAGVALGASIALAACGGGTSTSGGSDAGQAAKQAPTLETTSSEVGNILTDPSGRTVYMFVPDKGGESTCYGECADAWPALTTKGDPLAGSGIDKSLLGTTERKDGSKQVTYNGLALYYFAFDEGAGDINGQGSGNVWWTVSPEGKPIERPFTITTEESSKFGNIVTDAEGMSLYMFVPDKGGESTCYGECAKSWPALTIKGDALVGGGLDESQVDDRAQGR
jgi:predicted lipoprotein with Yx(FWY)xxD motif